MLDAAPDKVPSNGNSNTRKPRGNNRRSSNAVRASSKFEGSIPELKGYVYDCISDRQADQYVTTTRKIAEYFVRTHKDAGPFRNAILRLQLPTIPPVAKPTANADGTPPDKYDDMMFTEALKERNLKMRDINNLNMALYSLVWEQCSDAMKERLEGLVNYSTLDDQNDGVALLTAIKQASHSDIDKTYKIESANTALIGLVTYRQTRYQTVQQYYNAFKIRRDVHMQVGGNTEPSPAALAIMAKDLEVDVADLNDMQRRAARDRELAALFIHNADPMRFGDYQASLRNDYLAGNDNYPLTLGDAYGILAFRTQPPNHGATTTNSNDGVAFATNGTTDADSETNSDHAVTLANNGNKTGNNKGRGSHRNRHSNDKAGSNGVNEQSDDVVKGDNNNHSNATVNSYSSHSLVNTITSAATTSHLFNTMSIPIPRSWILLDNQSTVDIFCEMSLLDNVHESNETMSIQCNAGTITTTTKGTFGDYGIVWYCKDGIANILSFANARLSLIHI